LELLTYPKRQQMKEKYQGLIHKN